MNYGIVGGNEYIISVDVLHFLYKYVLINRETIK